VLLASAHALRAIRARRAINVVGAHHTIWGLDEHYGIDAQNCESEAIPRQPPLGYDAGMVPSAAT